MSDSRSVPLGCCIVRVDCFVATLRAMTEIRRIELKIVNSNNLRRAVKPRFCGNAPNLRKLSAHWKGMPAIIFSFALKNCGQGNLVSQNHGISQAQNSREIRELI